MPFFLPREAPVSVLWARVLVPLAALVGYVAFRAIPTRDGYLPIGEVLPMFAVVAGLTMLMLGAATELAARRRVEQFDSEVQAKLTNMLERTTVLPTPIPRTPVMMLDSDDLRRIHGDLFDADPLAWRTDQAARLGSPIRDALTPMVSDGTIEPSLFTHEFQPEHHTPARGMPAIEFEAKAPGRHRLRSVPTAGAQLGRERIWQLFGER